ncbi:MAG: SDR family NAD(P)-dependent oxidoreductase [Pseudomonadota bacterium]
MDERRLGNVWITGASSGIGEAFARLAVAKSTKIAISARSAEKLQVIEEADSKLSAYPLDVTDAKAVSETISAIESDMGGIDTAVLNAGVWKPMRADDMDLEAIHQSMEVNYFGVVNAVHALLPGMIKRGGGHIAIVASVAGYRGLPTAAGYGSSKAAAMHFAETMALELRRHGITVSIINPGFVDTPMTQVNQYNMPGIMSVDKAAKTLLDGLLKKKLAIFFPLGFTLAMRALNFLPYRLYYWLAGRMTGVNKKR